MVHIHAESCGVAGSGEQDKDAVGVGGANGESAEIVNISGAGGMGPVGHRDYDGVIGKVPEERGGGPAHPSAAPECSGLGQYASDSGANRSMLNHGKEGLGDPFGKAPSSHDFLKPWDREPFESLALIRKDARWGEGCALGHACVGGGEAGRGNVPEDAVPQRRGAGRRSKGAGG